MRGPVSCLHGAAVRLGFECRADSVGGGACVGGAYLDFIRDAFAVFLMIVTVFHIAADAVESALA